MMMDDDNDNLTNEEVRALKANPKVKKLLKMILKEDDDTSKRKIES